MRTFTEAELNQLLTPTEAAKSKGWSLNSFKYRAAKPGGPKAVPVGGGEVRYVPAEIDAWNPPTQDKRKQRPAGGGEGCYPRKRPQRGGLSSG